MELLKKVDWLHLGYALALVIFGLFVAKQVSQMATRAMKKRFSRHQALLVQRLIFYILFLIFLISALQQLGFKMTVLLGAAGVFTVALSFASQTAASNLVSGLFLLFERPFKIGDLIKIKDITGTVDSIDLLSTKIQTADNMRIRVPNETIMKSDITNMTYYKTRRVDIIIGVAYSTNIAHVKLILLEVANGEAQVLKEPEPQVILNQFADSAIELKLMVWVPTEVASSIKNQLNEQIKQRFEEENIDIPFPQLMLHKG